jgi:transposase
MSILAKIKFVLRKWRKTGLGLAEEQPKSKDQVKSAAEREFYLCIASERYMCGEISVEELKEIERHRDLDIKKTVLAFARRNSKQRRIKSKVLFCF